MSIVHTEFIDPQGLRLVQQLLRDLEASELSETQRARHRFLKDYLARLDEVYGEEMVGPLGLIARPLSCTYARIRHGRLHCHMASGPQWAENEPSYICAQGMPNVLRPFLMQKWGRDLDIENCHVALMYQLGRDYHTWLEHDGRTVMPLSLHMMQMLYENRNEFIEHIANFHYIASDSDTRPGYQKDIVKPLLLRILYGGSYDTWLAENNLFQGRKSNRVLRLQREVEILRDAILRSKRFEWLVKLESAAQCRRGRRSDAANRGIFSKVAQYLECEALLAIRQYLINKGWEIHSLVFDGLIVCHRPGVELDFADMERYVERETLFTVRIVEKPLYLHTPSVDKLLR